MLERLLLPAVTLVFLLAAPSGFAADEVVPDLDLVLAGGRVIDPESVAGKTRKDDSGWWFLESHIIRP